MEDPIVIVAAQRTPMGGMLGSLKDLTAYQLGSVSIKAVLGASNIQGNDIEQVIMGNVLLAGQGQNPARQATLGAGLPNNTGALTVNRVCGSGMQSLILANDSIKAGTKKIMIAGGMESMTNAPYLISKGRTGYRLGHGQLIDAMFLDGLEDAYDRGKAMGIYAEATVSKYGFTREQQDEFAITSLKRAQEAIKNGSFKKEIAAVTVKSRTGDVVVDTDEQPLNAKMDKIPTMKPAFIKDGTVTPANSSSISDGSAACLLMRRSEAEKRGLPIRAIIVAHADHSQEPAWFTTAPAGAIQKVLTKANWNTNQVDLYEINEAFACTTMCAIKDLELSPEKVNIHGGACALGHPIGASGSRLVVTLIHALEKYNLKRGVASLCIGGGEATAIAIERP